ncbi:MAG: PAS domain S-box protein [Promethearchaeota archaeon]|jgi:PAS domain S-box-containing protein
MANKVKLKNIVGEGLLNRIQNSYLKYMESSAAIYETNGDYAIAIFSSKYCDYLNQASRKIAGKTDDEALKSGKWICHEDCWATSLQSIKDKKPCEIECSGGIKIYAAPIIADGTVIGSNNVGLSNPPTDEKKIGEIAQKHKVDPKELLRIAKEYSPRPEHIMNAVKNHVSVAADTIAEFFLRIKAEEELQKTKDELEYRVEERTAELKSAIELLRDESDERKKIDKELKVSEKKYRNVVDNAIVGVVITNFDGEILYINNALVKMLEYESIEEITREKSITKYKNPNQREATIKIIKEKGRLDNHELELVTKTGKVKNILLSSVLEGNNMTSIMVDVTKRKHAEVSLRKSEIWLNSVLDQLNEGVMVISPDRLITYVNKTMEKMFGYFKDEFLGHSTRMLHINDEHYMRLGKIIKKEFEKNDAVVIEFDLKRKNGEVFLAENAGVFLRDESGTATGYLGVIRDISDRKRVEQALKESEKKYRALFEEAPDGIVLFDIEKGIHAEFNDKAHKTLGYTREEFQNLKLTDIEAAESPDEIQKHIEILFKHGSDVFETKHRKKDGEVLDILVSAQALTIGEKKFGQAIYTDITERKKTEYALKESELNLKAVYDNAGDGILVADIETMRCWVTVRRKSRILESWISIAKKIYPM